MLGVFFATPSVDQIEFLRTDWGWLTTMVLAAYELFWPYWDTKVQKIIHRIEHKIERVDRKQTHHIQVTRAMVRTIDEIDEDHVDRYLIDDSVSVNEFFRDPDKLYDRDIRDNER